MTGEHEPLLEGTLISHLLELRDRLLRAFIAVIIVFIPCMYYSNQLFEFLSRPLLAQLPAGGTLIATSITAPFTIPFKLAFIVALIIAMPYVLYEVWRFVAPGLYRHEKRFALPLLVSAILLFYAGVAFAYWVVFPLMFQFFVHTAPQGRDGDDRHHQLHGVRAGAGVLLRPHLRSAGRGRAAGDDGHRAGREADQIRGYVLIAAFVIAAILTPPDAFSQTVMAIPMYLLYEGGILFARLLSKKKPAEQPG